MTLQRTLAMLFGALGIYATRAHAQTPLDYARTIRDTDMVLVPYVGQERGPVFYTGYEQKVTSTSNTSGLKRLFVNLVPTAHTQNRYNDVIRRHAFSDARVLGVAAQDACRATDGIKQLLAALPDGYKPSILGGNYPILCSLSVYFLPEMESAVRSLLADSQAIALDATIALCAADSPRLETPSIVAALAGEGVVRTNGSGDVEGDAWELLYASALLSRNEPEWFGEQDPQQGWVSFLKLFDVDLATDRALLASGRASMRGYVCVPAPLTLHF